MKTQIKIHLILVFLFFQFNTFAQNHLNCGSSEYRERMIKNHPEIQKNQEQLEKFTENFIRNKKNNKQLKSGQTYVIPIVFHVLHEYGAENISDAQIFDAVRIINEDFSKQNADTSIVIPEFDSIIGKANIEFRLAQIDAFGNCTNGIDRIFSNKTNQADDFSKLNPWDRGKYLNVWVVKSIGDVGVAGFAYFPSSVDGFNFAVDGVLILHDYVGSIGTGNATRSRALTHEIGHYLNLEHPWGANNDAGQVCGNDGVFDTPITKGWTTCPNPSIAAVCTPNVIENFQNYMEYSFCAKMFTIGQADRMEAALNSSLSNRNNLWTSTNLIATGVDNPSQNQPCVPVADFSANRRMICNGETITFSDASWKAPISSTNWNFGSASPSTSSATNPTVTYTTDYWNDVTLTAQGTNGSNSVTKQNYIFVSPPWADFTGTFSEGFESNSTSAGSWFSLTNANNDSKWYIENQIGFTGNRSMQLNAYSALITTPSVILPIGKNDKDALISPAFDLSSVSTGLLNFKYATATRASNATNITEEFKVYASINCGKNWLQIYTNQGINLITAGLYSQPFYPTQQSQWQDVSINLQSIFKNPNVRFKFEYTSSDFSNNFFIDDINISGIVSVNDLKLDQFNANVYPNPAQNNVTLVYSLFENQKINISLYDLLGNEIMQLVAEQQSSGKHQITFNKENLSPGIYFIKLKGANATEVTKKLIFN